MQKPLPKRPSFSEWYRHFVNPHDVPFVKGLRAMQLRMDLRLDEPRESARELREGWNRFAHSSRDFVDLKILKTFYPYVFEQARLFGHEKVLSIGSGTAEIETFIAKYKVPNGMVTAIDVSDEMNKIGKALAEKTEAKNIKFITGISQKLPVASDSQDRVLLLNVTEGEKKYPYTIREIRRVLRKSPDSKVVICNQINNQTHLERFREAWHKEGFEIANHKLVPLPGIGVQVGYFTMRLSRQK